MNMIWEIIGKSELDELLGINGLLMDNYMEENKTTDAYISKYVKCIQLVLLAHLQMKESKNY